MCCAREPSCQEEKLLLGLTHLRSRVEDWAGAAHALTYTAATLAAGLGAAAGSSPARPPAGMQDDASSGAQAADPPPAAPAAGSLHAAPGPAPLPAPLPEAAAGPHVRVLPASALKPGRVFIVANLQGAYYTLLELLSRHRFDFRTDNLMHVGNLVALPHTPMGGLPPPAASASPAPPAAAAAARVGDVGAAAAGEAPPGAPGAQAAPSSAGVGAAEGAPRTCPRGGRRHSAAVLRLAARHGAAGPMGAAECLALLAAARARLAAAAAKAQEAQQERGREAQANFGGAPARGTAPGLLARALAGAGAGARAASGALPGGAQSAALGARGRSSLGVPDIRARGGVVVAAARQGATHGSRPSHASESSHASSHGSSSDSDTGADSSSSSGSESDGEGVRVGGAGGARTCSSYRGGGDATGGNATPAPDGLDDAALAQMLRMPACVVLEGYGVALQHSEPPPPRAGGECCAAEAAQRYHVIYSHRLAGGAGCGAVTAKDVQAQAEGGGARACACGAGCAATSTGLAAPRPGVVRYAVLPPLCSLLAERPPPQQQQQQMPLGGAWAEGPRPLQAQGKGRPQGREGRRPVEQRGGRGRGCGCGAVGALAAALAAGGAPGRAALRLEVHEEAVSELDTR